MCLKFFEENLIPSACSWDLGSIHDRDVLEVCDEMTVIFWKGHIDPTCKDILHMALRLFSKLTEPVWTMTSIYTQKEFETIIVLKNSMPQDDR